MLNSSGDRKYPSLSPPVTSKGSDSRLPALIFAVIPS